jgi:long-chain acyl-CoA synthetase
MINQILDFSRLEAGDMKLAVSRGDAASFTNRIVQSFQSWAERKRIALLFVCGSEWTIDNGLLTPTMKVRRARIEASVAPHIERWYATGRRVHWN